MRHLPKTLILLTLMLCVGCAKPSDISVARRDHILAGPHGWIDLTLHAPVAASAPASKEVAGLDKNCTIVFTVDGEPLIDERGDLAQADAAKSPLGYRFVAPAGALRTELAISGCVAAPLPLLLPLTLDNGKLAVLEFDGQRLSVASTQAWEPATLEAVRGEVTALHRSGDTAEGTLSTLTKLVIASVLLNVVALLVAIAALRRRTR
jgi:hypothetical protein